MFDSVWVRCPICQDESEFQSKSGDCLLYNYTLENCPDDVLANVNRHAPNTCENCGAKFKVDIEKRKPVLDNADTHQIS